MSTQKLPQNMAVLELKGMSNRILSVSYDVSLLATRKMLLEQRGYRVTHALGFSQAIAHCAEGKFDLFILGHSIPHDDKLQLMETFRANCPAPILSLERHGEDFVDCEFHASPDDPERFVEVVENILAGRESRSRLRLA
jgi:DNA-binding NtrC family response regulator